MVRETIRTHPEIENCHHCKDAFRNVSLHWERHQICEHPEYSRPDRAATIGLLLYRGYLDESDDTGNASLVCFFEDEDVANNLFDFYETLASKVVYVTGEEFFGQPIRRSYALFLRAHPYLTGRTAQWGTGPDKSVPDPSRLTAVTGTTYKLLYRLAGSRGFDGHDWAVFDCSRLQAKPYHLRSLLDAYDPFVQSDEPTNVVLRDSDSFFDDLEYVRVEF